MASKLNPKQQAFCEEYMIDLNGTQAAIRAGYSENSANEQASQLLAKLNIQEEVARLKAERSGRTEISADWVLNNFKEIAERCMQGVQVMDRQGRKMVPTGEWKFDSTGAIRANEMLARHLCLFPNTRVELTGKNGGPIDVAVRMFRDLSEDELDERINRA